MRKPAVKFYKLSDQMVLISASQEPVNNFWIDTMILPVMGSQVRCGAVANIIR